MRLSLNPGVNTMTTTFNRLVVVIGVLAVAGLGYSAGKSQPTPEQPTVKRSRGERQAARPAQQTRKPQASVQQAKPPQPSPAGTRGVKPIVGPKKGTYESITIFGEGFEDAATITF